MSRAAIRAAAVAALNAALAPTVTGARSYDYNRDELPAVQVSTPGESTELLDRDGYRRIETTLRVSFFEAEKAGADVEGTLDALAVAALAALRADATLSALYTEILSEGTEFDMGEPGETTPARLDLSITLLRLLEA